MFPLLAYLFGCGESSSARSFCPSHDEFGVADQTCIDSKKTQVVAQVSTASQPAPQTVPEKQIDTFENKNTPVFCPSVDEFGVRDPNCSRFR